jgi:hypothetical protein
MPAQLVVVQPPGHSPRKPYLLLTETTDEIRATWPEPARSDIAVSPSSLAQLRKDWPEFKMVPVRASWRARAHVRRI